MSKHPHQIIVFVVVHSRYWNLARWLETWQHCYRDETYYGKKLCVVANEHRRKTKTNIGKLVHDYNVDHFIERPNIGMDIGAMRDIIQRKYEGVNYWDYMMWFTDDTIPMKKDFIGRYMEAIAPEKVGLVGCHVSDERQLHVRTNGICLKRSVADLIKFPSGNLTKTQCYEFEHRVNTMTDQVAALGYEFAQVGELHEVAWDIGHHNHQNELANWQRYFAEFPECRRLGQRN